MTRIKYTDVVAELKQFQTKHFITASKNPTTGKIENRVLNVFKTKQESQPFDISNHDDTISEEDYQSIKAIINND
jgi:hypothetical protein